MFDIEPRNDFSFRLLMRFPVFYLQDRYGWEVTEWYTDHMTGDKFPMRKQPKWWNLYGKNMVRQARELGYIK